MPGRLTGRSPDFESGWFWFESRSGSNGPVSIPTGRIPDSDSGDGGSNPSTGAKMWFAANTVQEERYNLTQLLKAYDCQADLHSMTNRQLQDHVYEHQFDADAGEWPEDP
jgi:hypothetical protein